MVRERETVLAELLGPLRDQLPAEAEATPEPEPPPVRLDEGELMALIFEHLDPENLRVCEGIDFERLAILVEHPEAEAEAEPASNPAPPPAAPEPQPEPQPDDASSPAEPSDPAPSSRPAPSRSSRRILEHTWVGGDWTDDVRAIDPAILDRPALDGDQRDVLRRAGGRRLPTCNLRHMHRAPALTTLEAFVAVCRRRAARYCRVIPGKGIASEGEPVLKRTLLAWCQAIDQRDVLRWAPELDEHGEWGSAILELRAPGR